VEANDARVIARRVHAGQLSRAGEPLIDHVQRVAEAVPVEARALAYLHDVLERAEHPCEQLRRLGLNNHESCVLALLTRRPKESYKRYVMRIARAPGEPGRIARTIKLADLDDHLRQRRVAARAPDYAWARQTIVLSRRANREPSS
jgi:(p)ppGpp synthase/HD superfamily hydrolase